jgi:hypothetical protein
MRLIRRRPALLAVLAAALTVCAAYARPDVARGLNLDFWNLARLRGEIGQAERFDRELEAKRLALHRRLAVRHCVVKDLIRRRTTVAAAAAAYRRLNEALPFGLAELRRRTGRSNEEFACQQLLEVAAAVTWEWPPRERDAALARLGAEIQAHLAAAAEGASGVETEAD